MPAFERIESGFQGLDDALDSIRLGDNVVWQVSQLEDYRFFIKPFVQKAIEQKRNVIYVRFAQHESLLEPTEGLKIFSFDPESGFESFTIKVNEMISKEGKEAFYVFDCLSELQAAWWADLMMGNFFQLTCPHLFDLDTVAYFPILRGKHSFDTIARIRDTTQLLLDVYSEKEEIFLYPLKVWHRYSSSMFLPHQFENDSFIPLTDGVKIAHFYKILNQESSYSSDQNLDSWQRWFASVHREYQQGVFSKRTKTDLCKSMISREEKMEELVLQYFDAEDFFEVRSRMIGTGTIGGKACGMLLARKIISKSLPESNTYLEPHDSFYIGSDVFYTYIVLNNAWNLRIRQKTIDGWFTAAKDLKEQLLHGHFPDTIQEQFRRTLDYFGQSPIIVRSSSLLEDSFGNAFAGKYESVFCTNVGTFSERLAEFEQAIRIVYASTMDKSALEYRRKRGLAEKDEQMAILVQRVSGNNYGSFFMPAAAGVGYSYSSWRWLEEMDPSAGMLRLVAGLGTRAVDRTSSDYPRLANLDRPAASVSTSIAQKHRFSQSHLDVLDFNKRQLLETPLENLLPHFPFWYRNQVLERDYEAEESLRNRGLSKDVYFTNCQGLLENNVFTHFMKMILHTLQEAYSTPVDIEFTVNTNEKNDFVVNLLQCRPLQSNQNKESSSTPLFSMKKTLFEVQGSAMGNFSMQEIDLIVEVDPRNYFLFPYNRKKEIASAVGLINEFIRHKNKKALLLVPGRIGTSSPELGVPVCFADISNYTAICEVSNSSSGFSPELSYGSHLFQDLVESEIFYAALSEGGKTKIYKPELIQKFPDLQSEILTSYPELWPLIHIWDLKQEPLEIHLNKSKGDAIAALK